MSTTKTSLQNKLRSYTAAYPVIAYIFKWFCLSILIGLGAGIAAAGFLHSLTWVTNFREAHSWIIVFLPLAGLATGLLYYYKGKEVVAGNNLIIENIQAPVKVIPFRMAPFIYLGTMLTHLFGGSAGREGTALQLSGAIADQWCKPLRLTNSDRQLLLIAAIAAGFGAVFGTPLAGAVFALEVIIAGRLQYKAVLPAFAAAFIADGVTRLLQAQHTAYHIDVIPPLAVLPLLYAGLAGIAFGLCARLFTIGMHSTTAIFKRYIKYPPLQPVAGGILVAAAVFAIGTTKYIGLGIPTISASFVQQLPAYDFIVKLAFTIVTLAAGFKGGEVTPLFFIGAALGNALAYFIPLPVGLLAGMGFVAVFGGATKTPIACVVMAMELFGWHCGLYVGIACAVAYFCSGSKSIYTAQPAGGKLARYYRFRLKADLQDL